MYQQQASTFLVPIGYNSGSLTSVSYANSTNGTWVEFGQTQYELCGFWIRLAGIGTISTNGRFSIDIGISSTSGGTIYTVVDKFTYCIGLGSSTAYFPIRIPAGAYISMRGTRIGVTFSSSHMIVGKVAQPDMQPGFMKMVNLNVSSYEPSIDVGLGNAGTWVELISSLSSDLRGIGMIISTGSDTSRTSSNFTVELGIGSPSNEYSILKQSCYTHTTTSLTYFSHIEYNISSGQRISGRCLNQGGADSLYMSAFGLY